VILVDTSLWIDHLRSPHAELMAHLERAAVLAHPWVTGELALGTLRRPAEVIDLLDGLPQATVATPADTLVLIRQAQLAGTGVGYVDAQLLAATLLTPGAFLWTADRRLEHAAQRLGVAFAAA